jgi:hypothetical protein
VTEIISDINFETSVGSGCLNTSLPIDEVAPQLAGYIKEAWSKLESSVDKNKVVGITTNPNAFFKLNKLTLEEWFELTPKLCELVSNIRQDDKGVVYIQGPSSKMSSDDILRYAETVSKLTDGNTKVGLKIAPYDHILKIVPRLNEILDVNVTGVADAGTALKSITYPVRYMSIIPGRMEEAGIDAKSQIAFINQSNTTGHVRSLTEGAISWTAGNQYVFFMTYIV